MLSQAEETVIVPRSMVLLSCMNVEKAFIRRYSLLAIQLPKNIYLIHWYYCLNYSVQS